MPHLEESNSPMTDAVYLARYGIIWVDWSTRRLRPASCYITPVPLYCDMQCEIQKVGGGGVTFILFSYILLHNTYFTGVSLYYIFKSVFPATAFSDNVDLFCLVK